MDGGAKASYIYDGLGRNFLPKIPGDSRYPKWMSQPVQPPNVNIVHAPEYRDGYANSVQVRMSVWDFQLVFGTMHQESADEVKVVPFEAEARGVQDELVVAGEAPLSPPCRRLPAGSPLAGSDRSAR